MSTGVNSALAFVNAKGQLMCKLCNAPVKSAAVWTAHVNGKQHRNNAVQLKRKAAQRAENGADSAATAAPAKRAAVSSSTKPKPVPTTTATSSLPADFFDGTGATTSAAAKGKPATDEGVNTANGDEPVRAEVDADTTSARHRPATPPPEKPTSDLPEGFFDDKSTDRKARGVPDVDPQEAEWQRWQKELKHAEAQADVLEEEDEQRRDTQRTIEQLDEQIERWHKVNDMQDQFEQLAKSGTAAEMEEDVDEGDLPDIDLNDVDLDAALDWRLKTLK